MVGCAGGALFAVRVSAARVHLYLRKTRMPRVSRSTTRIVAVCFTALILASCDDGSTGGEDESGHPPAATRSLAVTDVACPKVEASRQRTVGFRPDDLSGASPHLMAEMTLHDLGARDSCVDAYLDETTPDDVAERITSYTVTVGENSANYGESYSTTDRTGSEELLNFPFAFHTYGACRKVTARVVVTDQDGTTHSYTAAANAGPHCPPN
jgi:hypothetical protein